MLQQPAQPQQRRMKRRHGCIAVKPTPNRFGQTLRVDVSTAECNQCLQ